MITAAPDATINRAPATEQGLDLDGVLRAMRTRGLRVTRARRTIVEVLVASSGSLCVEDITEAVHARGCIPDRSTVHRTMSALVEQGLVHRFATAGASGHRRWTYGLTGSQGYYALCSSCGEITAMPPEAVSELVEAFQACTGFVIEAGALGFHGRCQVCCGELGSE